ncbi:energy transducer TonB [Mariniflexile soesokkakense]|uniref:Energy transducer TonB n=1 Tax=Mariniflexile soesokkakense TaxID=1343160 RepID=A0ABV0A5Z4_9FLAO
MGVVKSGFILFSILSFNAFSQDIDSTTVIKFSIVDEIPITQDCKPKWEKEKLRKCVMHSINMHVNKKFNVGLAAEIGLSGRIKVTNTFTIDTEGNIVDIRITSPNDRLNEEAIRVLKLLPKMTPGKQNGKLVQVEYEFPIIFNVQD